jgi:hypothetical protein
VGVVGSTPKKKSQFLFTQIGIPAKNGGGGVRGGYMPVVTTISVFPSENISPAAWSWSFVAKHMSSRPGIDQKMSKIVFS